MTYRSHLLIIEYACSHWIGFNVFHRCSVRQITQKVPCLCPDCQEAANAT